MDISPRTSEQSPHLRRIYELLETEMISAITVPSSHPTTFHPTIAATRQHTVLHQKTLDDDILLGAEEESAGKQAHIFFEKDL